MKKKINFSWLTYILMMLALTMSAFGQGTTSRVTGTVEDSSGAAVAGATVTLTNEGTNISLKTQTSESGMYSFDLIQPGTYRITVEKASFKKFVSNGNPVNVNVPATINVAMQIGDVSAVVTVDSAAEQVQTSSSGNLGASIDQRTLETLPVVGLRGRNPLDILTYQPGFLSGANTGGGTHVHGSRDRAFNFTLDGIDINESSAGGSNFTPLRINPDSIQEFQYVSSNFTAELGRSSGAQVTAVTRPGTNQLKGNIFDYYQTPGVNANEYENNLNNAPKRQFVQHIFGGSVGGPIIKNKMFYFANLQLLRAYETRLVTRTVLTPTARNGVFRYVQGGTNSALGTSAPSIDSAGNPVLPICTTLVQTGCINTYNVNGAGTGIGFGNTSGVASDPALVAIFNSMPTPNNFFSGDGLNTAGFNFAAPQREKQYDFVTRVDYKFTDSNQIYVRYAQGQQDTVGDSANTGLRIFPDTPDVVTTFRSPKNLAINHRWAPSAKLTNEFIFGWSKFKFSFENPEPTNSAFFNFNLVTNPFSNFTSNARGVRVWQIIDNITLDYSPHIFKTGINFRFGQQADNRSSVAGADITPFVNFVANSNNSNYTLFNLVGAGTGVGQIPLIAANDLTRLRSFLNDMLGRVGTRSQAFVSDPSGGNTFAAAGTRWEWAANYGELDFYFQDTWKASSNFTLDLGLRYEPKLSPTSNGRPILAPSSQVNLGTTPTNSISFAEKKIFENDLDNFAPSIGFAWDPLKDGKTSIRANYRLNFDRFPTQALANAIFQSAPGNTFGASDTQFGANSAATVGGLIRNIGTATSLVPTGTPSAFRTPALFGTGSITVLDTDLKFPEVHSWSLSFQREIPTGIVFEVNYIGKHGTNLFGGYNSNQVNINARHPGCSESFLEAFNFVRANVANNSCLINLLYTGNSANNAGTATFRSGNSTAISQGSVAGAALSVSQRTCQTADLAVPTTNCTLVGQQLISRTIGFGSFIQKFPQFSGGLNVLDTNDYSWYHGLELIAKKRFKDGLNFQASYTFSKSMDTRSFDPTFTQVGTGNAQSASSTPFDIQDRSLNYAWSDFDRRHALQGTAYWEIPFGKGKKYGNNLNSFLDALVGGWKLSSGLNFATGRPFTVYSGITSFSNVVQSTADCNGCRRNLGQLIQENGTNYWFSADARSRFSQPNPGSNGNTGRNFFIGPRQFFLDSSLSKKFIFTERWSLDLRVDGKNLTNTENYGFPTATQNATTFGRIRDAITSSSRRLQFSAKINF
jgi:hypothetical protein